MNKKKMLKVCGAAVLCEKRGCQELVQTQRSSDQEVQKEREQLFCSLREGATHQ
jgi:hypothetical protein